MTCVVARETARAKSLSSSPSTSARASVTTGSRPSAASARSWGLNSEPRTLGLGHTVSWRPTTATVSTSRPSAPDGVATSTASADGCGARVSSGTSASSSWLTKVEGAAPGSRSTKRFAAVKSATTPSRFRFASSAASPTPIAWADQGSASPLALHSDHSSSSMLAPSSASSRAVRRVAASFAANRDCGVSMVTNPAPEASASTRSSSLPREFPPSSSSCRSARRRRRRPTASIPPSGPSSRSTATFGVSASGRSATSTASSR